jgi:hypothetical protein
MRGRLGVSKVKYRNGVLKRIFNVSSSAISMVYIRLPSDLAHPESFLIK